MVNLNAVNQTMKTYVGADHELLIMGLYKDKRLNPQQRSIDLLIENKLSKAMELDRFSGEENKQLMVLTYLDRIIKNGLDGPKPLICNSLFCKEV